MRHLLGRAAVLACAFALYAQPSFAHSVPKHHSVASAKSRFVKAHTSKTRLAKSTKAPKLRRSLGAPRLARVDVPLPMARPAQPGDRDVLALADIPVPAARPDWDDPDADNADAAAADDQAPDTAPGAVLAQADAPAPDLSGDDAPRIEVADRSYNCVAYMRERTAFVIKGDAGQWWDHAEGYYDRAPTPAANAVMVFAATRSMKRGHVALVTKLVSDRQIVVDHANWMRDGKLYLNMPVMDVSPENDWSEVRVWNARDGQWGARVYPIKGFVSARPAA
jgi:hypothetical protein